MLRHSRADTYWMNRKHKERDKTHGTPKYLGCLCGLHAELEEASYIKRHQFSLREYLRKAWDYIY